MQCNFVRLIYFWMVTMISSRALKLHIPKSLRKLTGHHPILRRVVTGWSFCFYPQPPPIPLYSSPGQIIVPWVTGLYYLLAVISLTQWPYYIPPGWGTWWLWWTIKMHQHGYLFYARWRLMRFLVLCIIVLVLVIILIRNQNGNSTIHWQLQWTRGIRKRPVRREVGSLFPQSVSDMEKLCCVGGWGFRTSF